jgi:hypothetical protein
MTPDEQIKNSSQNLHQSSKDNGCFQKIGRGISAFTPKVDAIKIKGGIVYDKQGIV